MAAQRMLTEERIPAYVRGLGLAAASEPVAVEAGGDGNINWVRRVRVGGERPRSFVLKQARPALERFPQYAAPTERLLCEARWFELARPHDADAICPRVLALDVPNRVLALEDLSACERLDVALARDAAVAPQMESLARFLARVHAASEGDGSLPARFENDAMRRLHGDHIFALPFQANDFGLTPRLEAAAREARADRALVRAASDAHEHYLRPSGALVHADVQAGNVLLAPGGGVKLLDAEIAHAGDAAFDLGMLLAPRTAPSGAALPRRSRARSAMPASSSFAARSAPHDSRRLQRTTPDCACSRAAVLGRSEKPATRAPRNCWMPR
jgi:5-methylthioribose kinase